MCLWLDRVCLAQDSSLLLTRCVAFDKSLGLFWLFTSPLLFPCLSACSLHRGQRSTWVSFRSSRAIQLVFWRQGLLLARGSLIQLGQQASGFCLCLPLWFASVFYHAWTLGSNSCLLTNCFASLAMLSPISPSPHGVVGNR